MDNRAVKTGRLNGWSGAKQGKKAAKMAEAFRNLVRKRSYPIGKNSIYGYGVLGEIE